MRNFAYGLLLTLGGLFAMAGIRYPSDPTLTAVGAAIAIIGALALARHYRADLRHNTPENKSTLGFLLPWCVGYGGVYVVAGLFSPPSAAVIAIGATLIAAGITGIALRYGSEIKDDWQSHRRANQSTQKS